MALTHLKYLAGYTAHAQFLAECDQEPAPPNFDGSPGEGTVARFFGEYRLENGTTRPILRHKGRMVVILEATGIRKRVFVVD